MKTGKTISLLLLFNLVCAFLFAACSGSAPDKPTLIPNTPGPTPSITTFPTSGGAGTQVTIVGAGFPANAHVSVRLRLPGAGAGPLTYAEATTDEKGEAGIVFGLPAQWPDGRHITENKLLIMVATDDFSAQAEAEFNFTPAAAPPTPTAVVVQPTAPPVIPTPIAGYPQSPAEVVNKFLQSLLADPGGQTSRLYLSRALQAELDAGRSPLQILGLPALYQSFIVAAGPNVGDSATFYVTFNLGGSQQSRVFILNEEDGVWRLQAIAAAEGVTLTDPGQVTHDFLISLLKDPSGNSSLKYLSLRRAAEVQSGVNILALLGVQSLYKSFTYEIIVMNAGGRSTIRVTLDYDAGAQVRTFTLIQEGGGWRIDAIAGQ